MAKLPAPPPAPRGAGAAVPAPAGARRARRPAVVAAPPPPPPAPRLAAPAGGRRRTPPAAPAVRVVAPPAGGPPPAPAPVAPPPHPATGQSNWLVGLIIVALGLLLWYFNPFGKKEVMEQARPAVTASQPASAQVEQPAARPAPRTAVEQQLDATASKPLSEMSYSECEQYWLIVRGKVMEGYGNHHWSSERGCQ